MGTFSPEKARTVTRGSSSIHWSESSSQLRSPNIPVWHGDCLPCRASGAPTFWPWSPDLGPGDWEATVHSQRPHVGRCILGGEEFCSKHPRRQKCHIMSVQTAQHWHFATIHILSTPQLLGPVTSCIPSRGPGASHSYPAQSVVPQLKSPETD